MKIKTTLLIIISLGIFAHVNAQQTFLKTLGGTGDEDMSGVIATNDGNYLIFGRSTSYGNGGYDGMLLKVDADGNQLWTKYIGGNNDEFLEAGLELSNGDLIFVGRTKSYGNGDFDGYIIRTDNQGNLLWTKTFGGNSFDRLLNVIITSDGNLLVGGFTDSFGFGAWDMLVMKMTTNGNIIWTKTYGAYSNDWMRQNALKENTAGNYIITGISYNTGLPMHNGVLLEIESSTGNILYSQLYGNNNNDGFNEFLVSTNDKYIHGNTTYNNNSHLWLNKLNANNTINWSKRYVVSGVNSSTNIGIFDNNDLIFGGISNYNSGSGEAYMFKVSSAGNVLWAKSYGGSNDEIIKQIFKIPTGYLAFGYTNSYGQGNRDVMIIKTDNQGNIAGCSNNITVNETTIFPSSVNLTLNQNSVSVGQNQTSGIVTTTLTNSIICPLFPIANFQINNVCQGDCISINDNSINVDTWEWIISGANNGTFTSQNISNFCFNNAGTTTIQLVVNNAAGSDTSIQTIQVDALPSLNLGNDTLMCSGDIIALNTNIANATYLWSNNSNNATLTITNGGLYWVEVDSGACTVQDSILINEVVPPNIDLVNDTSICLGNTLNLNVFHADIDNYLWQDGSTNATYNISQSGTYFVTASNICGSDTDTINIDVVNTNITLELGNDTVLCTGQMLTLDVTNADIDTYLWQDNSTNPIFTIDNSGEYFVLMQNACITLTDTINVVVTGDAPIIDLDDNVEICIGDEAILDATTSTANSYEWQDGSTNPTFTATTEGQYTVIATNNCGQSTDSIFVNTIDCNCYVGVPNVFSPSSNLNNTFSPKKAGVCNFTNYKLMIFNRWGNLVFETNDFDQSWDGIYNSQEQPQDTYTYVVEYELATGVSETLKGSVLLVR